MSYLELSVCFKQLIQRNSGVEPFTFCHNARSTSSPMLSASRMPRSLNHRTNGGFSAGHAPWYNAKFQGGSGVTFINMGGGYPNNPFTAVIIGKDRRNFNYKPEKTLSGKTICVIGTVKEYKGKPEIVVDNQEQILVQ